MSTDSPLTMKVVPEPCDDLLDQANGHRCRVAFFGLPGAGKSTAASLLRSLLSSKGTGASVVPIAEPLYDVQRFFYERCGQPVHGDAQDGALLNFLGGHYRSVEPEFLLDDFLFRVGTAERLGTEAVICSDARPADLDRLADNGFHLVRIDCSPGVRARRKGSRADRRQGRDDDPTEVGGDDHRPDHVVANDGTLAELENKLKLLDGALVGRPTPSALTPAGVAQRLVEHAEALISRCYVESRHQIAAALLDRRGRIFTGLHMEAMVGRASICAEASALAAAIAQGADELVLVAAVRHPKPSETSRGTELVPPCGLCRELLLDYASGMEAAVGRPDGLRIVPLQSLLPDKYTGTKWRTTGTSLAAMTSPPRNG